jgi:release factor glutamine methyltransferase
MHTSSKLALGKLLKNNIYYYALKNYSKRLLKKLKKGELLSKIFKKKEFYNGTFKTTYDTLDPRWDTELLIEVFLEKFKLINNNKRFYTLVDMCTGTGVIGISLLKEIRSLRCEFVDISHKALQVCKTNIRNHKLWHKSKINKISLMDYPNKQIDFFVSNPPYLLKSEIEKNNSYLKYDPFIALYGGKDGLDFYRTIASYVVKNVKYFIVIEIDDTRTEEIKSIFIKAGVKNIEIFKYIDNLNRVLYGEI